MCNQILSELVCLKISPTFFTYHEHSCDNASISNGSYNNILFVNVAAPHSNGLFQLSASSGRSEGLVPDTNRLDE
jgi:hypothetical protein